MTGLGWKRANYTKWVRCPVCKRKVKGYVPRGGDGTVLRPYRHTNPQTDEICEGRFYVVEEEPIRSLSKTHPQTP